MSAKTVLILGGGSGGVVAAQQLRSKLGREHRVVMVDRRANHSFTGSYVWLLNGQRRVDQVERPLKRLERKGIEIVQGDVTAIDTERGQVTVAGQPHGYDYLVVSLGAELDPAAIPGLGRAGINVYQPEGLIEAQKRLNSFDGGRVVVAISRMPYKCPAAPYEFAMIADEMLRARGVRDRSEIEIVTFEPAPMPVAGPVMGQAVLSRLEPKGIRYRPNSTIASMDPEQKTVNLEGDEAVPFDLLLAVPPHKCAPVLREAGLTGESGWVPVDPGTLRSERENVYVIGDAAIIKLPNGKFLPKAGVFAHKHAETVAQEIAADIKGRPQPQPYDGEGYCFLELGDGRAGFAKGNFYAEPDPQIEAKAPSKVLHLSKVAFEKYWFRKYL